MNEKPQGGESVRRRTRLWPMPLFLFLLHAFAVVLFSGDASPIAGPDTDAGAMVWLLWLFIDFPLGLVAIGVAEGMPTNAIGVAAVVIIGGCQWALWGLGIAAIIRFAERKDLKRIGGYCVDCGYDLRGNPAATMCPECGAKIEKASQ